MQTPVDEAADWVVGKFLNRTYCLSIAKLPAGQDGDSPDFPIEATRLKGVYFLIVASALGSVGYGLALMTRAVSSSSPYWHARRSNFPGTAYLSNDRHAIHDRPDNGWYIHGRCEHHCWLRAPKLTIVHRLDDSNTPHRSEQGHVSNRARRLQSGQVSGGRRSNSGNAAACR